MESKFIDWSHLLLLVLLLTLHRCIHAQSATSTAPSFGLSLRDNLKASFSTVMVVAFLSAFVFMGFFSLYLRHCTNSYVSTRNPIAAAADILRSRLHREAINKCPILIYSAVRDLQMGKSPLECAVCLGEFQDKDKIRLLPKCHHVFHPDCIDAWFISHLTCPVCRATLTSPDCSDNAGVGLPMASNPDESGESEAQISTTESQEPPARTIRVGETGTTSSSSSSSSSSSTARLAQTSPPTQSRVLERLPRSHSTGHSLFMESEEMTDRYALRLPEHGRGQITANHSGIRRSASSDVVLPGVWGSKRGWHRGEGEGCGHMERWAFSSMTPPFVKSSMENTETSSSHRPPV